MIITAPRSPVNTFGEKSPVVNIKKPNTSTNVVTVSALPHGLAVRGRQYGNPQIKLIISERGHNLAVLRKTLLGDVEIRHDLDS